MFRTFFLPTFAIHQLLQFTNAARSVYPRYAASLFAGNDFARSSLAFAAVLFSRPMYIGLNIGPGTSLLGGLTAGCIVGVFVLYIYGDRLRARSKFSAK